MLSELVSLVVVALVISLFVGLVALVKISFPQSEEEKAFHRAQRQRVWQETCRQRVEAAKRSAKYAGRRANS